MTQTQYHENRLSDVKNVSFSRINYFLVRAKHNRLFPELIQPPIGYWISFQELSIASRRTIKESITDLLSTLEPDPFVSPEGLLPAQISPKELAAIDLFLYTMTQIAQHAVVIGLLIPMVNLSFLPGFLFSVATVINLFATLLGFA